MKKQIVALRNFAKGPKNCVSTKTQRPCFYISFVPPSPPFSMEKYQRRPYFGTLKETGREEDRKTVGDDR